MKYISSTSSLSNYCFLLLKNATFLLVYCMPKKCRAVPKQKPDNTKTRHRYRPNAHP